MAGTNSDYLRRLKNDGRQDLIDKIKRGEITVYAAAVLMGYRKKRSAASRSDQISYHYLRADKDEKLRFVLENINSLGPIVLGLIKRQRAIDEAKKPSE
ncbi:MAG: hypothetical protein ABJ205_04325 [Erythrobacter sp.]|uniref:hypothetical protein n=1 Tax=Erythrobacter sp. TaxID=1042 RepID=UPI003265F205